MKKFNRVVRSFAELGAIMGISPKKSEDHPKKKVCHKCGALMKQVPGTNAWVCNGTIKEKDKDGKVIKERACNNYTMERVSPPVPVAHPA